MQILRQTLDSGVADIGSVNKSHKPVEVSTWMEDLSEAQGHGPDTK